MTYPQQLKSSWFTNNSSKWVIPERGPLWSGEDGVFLAVVNLNNLQTSRKLKHHHPCRSNFTRRWPYRRGTESSVSRWFLFQSFGQRHNHSNIQTTHCRLPRAGESHTVRGRNYWRDESKSAVRHISGESRSIPTIRVGVRAAAQEERKEALAPRA